MICDRESAIVGQLMKPQVNLRYARERFALKGKTSSIALQKCCWSLCNGIGA